MFTKAFWKAAGERAAKTAAQVALLKFGADSIAAGFDVLAADWIGVGSFALGGAVLSALSSIVSAKATDGSPSLATETLAE
ncbi:holin [Agrococcus pavilionensis RW1]|uniref:Holin n=1 Tax=Agrococcus pavilionensis RW1 TaxID=1330458 RepID=U1LMC2_9MICO|nr:holin [Agrococcus pavilionensis]ERG63474.1 holin [Agrococcus pavilionensis RW1]